MDYELQRIASGRGSTMGVMYAMGRSSPHAPPGMNREWRCMVVEDEYRAVKVAGETRVPAGTYEIRLRTEGGMHATYSKKYPWHRGMLWLQNVPNFEFVYIHTGNKESETEGCLLTGNGAQLTEGQYETMGSIASYERVYREMSEAIGRGERTTLTIVDVA